MKDLKQDKSICGKFSFEIRAWDISVDGLAKEIEKTQKDFTGIHIKLYDAKREV